VQKVLMDHIQDQYPLDSIVLSLLHRHREDVMPTGQTFSAPPTPTKSPSRSSSFRRTAASTAQSTTLARRAGTPTRPLSPSPLRPLSPSVQRESDVDPLPSSPFGSPRIHLSVNANEFKPRMPTPSSPQPNWSFQSSPLGTPKFSPAASTHGANSYFPAFPSTSKISTIPREPWGVPSISTSTSSESSAEEPRDSFSPLIGHRAIDEWPPPASYDDQNTQASWWETSEADQQHPRGDRGLSGEGAYEMSPFDVLYVVFAGSDISPTELEDALARNGWDVDKAVEWITNRLAGSSDDLGIGSLGLSTDSPPPRARFLPASGSRPLVVPREILSPDSGTPVKGISSSAGSASSSTSNRICRYYLQGNCLRSDCR
jgi:hypothetical protein